jgi:anti-sigma regulatory factor (Ser/Thr protein kinase)
VLERLSPERASDAELLISELVTIAVVHSAERSDVVLTLADEDDVLRVEVRDAGAWFEAERTTADEAARTWGIRLLDRIADRWGIERREGRTLAWFEIDERAALRSVPDR